MSFRPLPAPETGLSEGGAAPTARLKAAPHLSSLGSNGASKNVHFFFPQEVLFFFFWCETIDERQQLEGGPKVILHGLW